MPCVSRRDGNYILREIKTSLQPYMDDDGLAAPAEAHVVVADK